MHMSRNKQIPLLLLAVVVVLLVESPRLFQWHPLPSFFPVLTG